MKNAVTTLVFIFFVSLNTLANQKTIKYFSTIQFMESPYQDFKGIISLTKDVAMKRNHYRFEYDEKGRLIKISFLLGDKLRNPNFTANYFFLSPIIKIDYEENKEIRTFYDRFEVRIPVRGSVFKEIYELDEKGNKIKLHFENNNGKKIQSAWNMAEYTWQINIDKTVTEKRYNLNGESVTMRPDLIFHTVKFAFDTKKNLVLIQNIDEQNNLVENQSGASQDILEYDDNDAFIGWSVLNKKNQLKEGNAPNVAHGKNTTNEFGYYQKTLFFNKNLTPMISAYGFYGNSLEFDKFGNISFLTFLNEKENPGSHTREGLVYIKYTYDITGYNLIRTDFLDIEKKPFLHPMGGYASQKDSFNHRDVLIRTDYLDHVGNNVNITGSGFSSIVRELDNKNRMVKLSHLDADGKLVNEVRSGMAYLTVTFDDEKGTSEMRRFDKDGNQLL